MSKLIGSALKGLKGAFDQGVDAKMRFSLAPGSGDTGFNQWHDAMRMVVRLPGGVPAEFRQKLWIALADRHIQMKRIDWERTKRTCFNERSNPDDDALGIQIVKDLHRTGCSLFSGDDAEHNQALLKQVLLAYARWNKDVGYCQGFNMLAAIILEAVEWNEEDALKVMIFLIEGVIPSGYFASNLHGLSVDMAVFRDLLKMRLPELARHLEKLQIEAQDSSGTSYEPPLTNVFTMQWFLTLFSTCLPKPTVLRVWDLIFLEGSEILLRTALAIWNGLEDRIMPVDSADEFYSIMGVLTREMMEFGLMDANVLIQTVCTMAPFPFPQLSELRDKYMYNIRPLSSTLHVSWKKFNIFSDDEEESEDDQAVMASWCLSNNVPIPTKGGRKSRTPSPSATMSNFSSHGMDSMGGHGGYFSGEKMALDISVLKKQYSKLRERQKQARVILTGVFNDAPQPMKEQHHQPVAVNHLLIGKKPVQKRFSMPAKPKTLPRRMSADSIHLMPRKLKDKSPVIELPPDSGSTISWKDIKTERRSSCRTSFSSSSIKSSDRESLTPENQDNVIINSPNELDEKDLSSSGSSTSTELCDEIHIEDVDGSNPDIEQLTPEVEIDNVVIDRASPLSPEVCNKNFETLTSNDAYSSNNLKFQNAPHSPVIVNVDEIGKNEDEEIPENMFLDDLSAIAVCNDDMLTINSNTNSPSPAYSATPDSDRCSDIVMEKITPENDGPNYSFPSNGTQNYSVPDLEKPRYNGLNPFLHPNFNEMPLLPVSNSTSSLESTEAEPNKSLSPVKTYESILEASSIQPDVSSIDVTSYGDVNTIRLITSIKESLAKYKALKKEQTNNEMPDVASNQDITDTEPEVKEEEEKVIVTTHAITGIRDHIKLTSTRSLDSSRAFSLNLQENSPDEKALFVQRFAELQSDYAAISTEAASRRYLSKSYSEEPKPADRDPDSLPNINLPAQKLDRIHSYLHSLNDQISSRDGNANSPDFKNNDYRRYSLSFLNSRKPYGSEFGDCDRVLNKAEETSPNESQSILDRISSSSYNSAKFSNVPTWKPDVSDVPTSPKKSNVAFNPFPTTRLCSSQSSEVNRKLGLYGSLDKHSVNKEPEKEDSSSSQLPYSFKR